MVTGGTYSLRLHPKSHTSLLHSRQKMVCEKSSMSEFTVVIKHKTAASNYLLLGCELESRAGRNCRWGEWMYSALSTFNTTTEVPLNKAPNPQLLPGRRSINGCPLLQVCVHGVCVFTAVCVHLGWDKCRAQIQSMGHHTWSYVCHFTSLIQKKYLLREYVILDTVWVSRKCEVIKVIKIVIVQQIHISVSCF